MSESYPADPGSARTLVIMNPRSGQRRARRVVRTVTSELEQHGPVELKETGKAGDAFRFARALGSDTEPLTARVVVIGGDGTINEVANGLMTAGRHDVPMGLIPFGTGNLLAKQYGIPIRRSRAAARVVATGIPKRLDIVRVGYPEDDQTADETHVIASERRRIMTGVAGAGFDGEVARRFHASRKRWAPGFTYYAWLALAVGLGWKMPVTRVIADGKDIGTGRWVLVCNTSTYGGPMTFVKDARPDDGELDVVIFRYTPLRHVVSHFWWAIIRRNASRHRHVHHVRVKQCVELLPAPIPGGDDDALSDAAPCQIDGDPVGPIPIRFEPDRERFLRIIAPI